jgi:predicted nucleotidyltransferase
MNYARFKHVMHILPRNSRSGAVCDEEKVDMGKKPMQKADLWARRLAARARHREALRVERLERLTRVITEMQKKYRWSELIIFGSLVRPGRFGESSDADIAVSGLPKEDYYSFVGDVSALFGHDVDVVNLEECPFAASILRGGIRWTTKAEKPFS